MDSLGRSSILPYLPLMLTNGSRTIEVTALLDTGASVNVLPYEIGLQLGAAWEEQTVSVPLSGNLALQEARGLVLSSRVARYFIRLAGICLDSSKRCACHSGTHELFRGVQRVLLWA